MESRHWDLSKLNSLIANKVEENLSLDYKAADALQLTEGKKNEIGKDVSAMANAAGGVIIYGIREFPDKAIKHLPEKIDPIIRTTISKEWLEQVIMNNIQPKISGIIITPITIDDKDGTVVYVVEIPQGNTAHQASDKKYYKRNNFMSVPMDDYEIRDIMGRLNHPEMTLEFIMERKKVIESKPKILPPSYDYPAGKTLDPKIWFEYQLKVAVRNTGKVYANYVNYYLELPSHIVHLEENLNDSSTRIDYKEFYGENTYRDVIDVETATPDQTSYKYGPSRYDPVLPGMRSRFDQIRLVNDLIFNNETFYWKIYADNADIKTGSITLLELQSVLKE